MTEFSVGLVRQYRHAYRDSPTKNCFATLRQNGARVPLLFNTERLKTCTKLRQSPLYFS